MSLLHLIVQFVILSSGFGLWVILLCRMVAKSDEKAGKIFILYTMISILILVNIFLFLSYRVDSLYMPLLNSLFFKWMIFRFTPLFYSVMKWATLLFFACVFATGRDKIFYPVLGAAVLNILFLLIQGDFNPAVRLAGNGLTVLYGAYVFNEFRRKSGVGGKKAMGLFMVLYLPVQILNTVLKFPFLTDLDPGVYIYHRLILFFLFSLSYLINLHVSRPGEKPFPNDLESFCRDCGLSTREEEVFRLLIDHFSYRDIMDRLFISLDTVKSHSRNIYRKTGVKNRNELCRLVKV